MLSVGAVTLLIHDGKTNWFEGFQLLADLRDPRRSPSTSSDRAPRDERAPMCSNGSMRIAVSAGLVALLPLIARAEVEVTQANGHVDLKATAAPVSEVLDRLGKQTGMKVTYDGAPGAAARHGDAPRPHARRGRPGRSGRPGSQLRLADGPVGRPRRGPHDLRRGDPDGRVSFPATRGELPRLPPASRPRARARGGAGAGRRRRRAARARSEDGSVAAASEPEPRPGGGTRQPRRLRDPASRRPGRCSPSPHSRRRRRPSRSRRCPPSPLPHRRTATTSPRRDSSAGAPSRGATAATAALPATGGSARRGSQPRAASPRCGDGRRRRARCRTSWRC